MLERLEGESAGRAREAKPGAADGDAAPDRDGGGATEDAGAGDEDCRAYGEELGESDAPAVDEVNLAGRPGRRRPGGARAPLTRHGPPGGDDAGGRPGRGRGR